MHIDIPVVQLEKLVQRWILLLAMVLLVFQIAYNLVSNIASCGNNPFNYKVAATKHQEHPGFFILFHAYLASSQDVENVHQTTSKHTIPGACWPEASQPPATVAPGMRLSVAAVLRALPARQSWKRPGPELISAYRLDQFDPIGSYWIILDENIQIISNLFFWKLHQSKEELHQSKSHSQNNSLNSKHLQTMILLQ